MLNFSGALGAVATVLVATGVLVTPARAVAQRQVIDNDLSRCAPSAGPAVLVDVSGFKGATGKIRVQAYPATRSAWLESGAWIDRIDVPVQASNGRMKFCLPLPAPGRYGIAVRHDRNGNGKTDLREDGGGFSNNPKASIFNLGKPSVDKAAITVGNAPTSISITLQYF
ncbi:DUF2141 domain-containing protein [Sphingobium subterraneum]|uniref:Uncharacterized protein (DUF2141 family) n=1 Tax=Sphingobium subterraneum TaxID=627688 RepID=A0A841J6V3_9SPHN|nr:DUF2141 domain-containing protein [Sphingobium subterraneum]MBB6124265.1 uncharacterized protein (DUF2141 family) [Sphingobium subterraneum]